MNIQKQKFGGGVGGSGRRGGGEEGWGDHGGCEWRGGPIRGWGGGSKVWGRWVMWGMRDVKQE